MHEQLITELTTELRTVIADLGKDGGLISPSIYDTAQVLRFYPPDDVNPALDWLLAQQEADGGWGNPAVPTARDVPTLAAILALHTYRKDQKTRKAVEAGLIFLREQAAQWAEIEIDLVPIAAEMILPYLIDEANSMGIEVACAPYAFLYGMREQKLKYLAQMKITAGSAPTYSWEALGHGYADTQILDRANSIGHSPAATAAWLRLAQQESLSDDLLRDVELYLANASAATGVGIPGVVPLVWPITDFERSYGAYAQLVAGINHHPALSDEVQIHARELAKIMTLHNGLSFSEHFTPDVDGTAVGVALLCDLKMAHHADIVMQFQRGDHFYTYQYELNASVLSNAHALHALEMCGTHAHQTEAFLCERQQPDGRWLPDKWHSSWHYTSLEVIMALLRCGQTEVARRSAQAFVQSQRQDGGWGYGGRSVASATSHAVLALNKLQEYHLLDGRGQHAMLRGQQWLLDNFEDHQADQNGYWLGKELYSAKRVDRAYMLSAMLATILERIPT